MAQASTEVGKMRQRVTALTEAQAQAGDQLRIITYLGNGDFVAGYLVNEDGTDATDISLVEWQAGVAALGEVLASITPQQAAAIAKLRI